MAIATLIVGFILGFLTGTRAKQVVHAVKHLPTALRSLSKLLKEVAPAGEAAGDDGDDERVAPEDEPEAELALDELVPSFLDESVVPGLDDHRDVEVSPIFLYQMKKAKEETRKQRLRDQLLSEGVDPNDTDAYLVNQSTGRQRSSLAFLIAHGARFEPVAGRGADAASRAQQERRRQMRTVDSYLQKHLALEPPKKSTVTEAKQDKRLGITVRKASALDVAVASGVETPRRHRFGLLPNMAQSARSQLKYIQRTRPLSIQLEQELREREEQEQASLDEKNSPPHGRNRKAITAADLDRDTVNKGLEALRMEFDEYGDLADDDEDAEERLEAIRARQSQIDDDDGGVESPKSTGRGDLPAASRLPAPAGKGDTPFVPPSRLPAPAGKGDTPFVPPSKLPAPKKLEYDDDDLRA